MVPNHIGNALESAHQKLIISYGAQLEYALLPVVDGDGMKLIAEACPNARFKIDFSCPGQIEILKALGTQLIIDNSIRPQDSVEGDYDSYSKAWTQCSNLQVLHLPLVRDMDYVGGIFAIPKYRLKTLDILSDNPIPELDKILELVAYGT